MTCMQAVPLSLSLSCFFALPFLPRLFVTSPVFLRLRGSGRGGVVRADWLAALFTPLFCAPTRSLSNAEPDCYC